VEGRNSGRRTAISPTECRVMNEKIRQQHAPACSSGETVPCRHKRLMIAKALRSAHRHRCDIAPTCPSSTPTSHSIRGLQQDRMQYQIFRITNDRCLRYSKRRVIDVFKLSPILDHVPPPSRSKNASTLVGACVTRWCARVNRSKVCRVSTSHSSRPGELLFKFSRQKHRPRR
jgi:hypothetical protein